MSEPLEVVVALVGDPANPDRIDEDCARPYKEREKVTVQVQNDESLRSVLDQAISSFSDSNPGTYDDAGRSLAFYKGDPDERVELFIPSTQTVTITSGEGLALWHIPPEQASMQDLVLARQRKVFKGDPIHPYLVVDPHWRTAGGTPGGWDAVLQILEVLGYAFTVKELAKYGITLKQKGADLVSRVVGSWDRNRKAALYARTLFEERGADIMDVIETARAAESYRIADIMAWTGIDDPAIAIDLAGLSGYQLDEGSESLRLDPDEDFVGLTSQLPIDMSVNWYHEDEVKALAEAVLQLTERLRDLGLIQE